MAADDLKSDWLQEKLREIASRLLQADASGEDFAWCADQLQRIVVDLKSPDESFYRPRRRRSASRRLLTAGAVGLVAAICWDWMKHRHTRKED